MTRRALRPVVEVGFGSGPADPEPDWVDITDRVWGEGSGPQLGVQRGRSGERAQLQPGSCTFVLDNTDGVFDPDNEAGPFHGLLVDGVPIRVRATPDPLPVVLELRGRPVSIFFPPGEMGGDFDIRLHGLTVESWRPGDDLVLVHRSAIAIFGLTPSGAPFLDVFDVDGDNPTRWLAPAAIEMEEGHRLDGLRVVFDRSAGTAVFYRLAGGLWRPLGPPVEGPANLDPFPFSGGLSIGEVWLGTVERFEVFVDGGTPLVNPDFSTWTPGERVRYDGLGNQWALGNEQEPGAARIVEVVPDGHIWRGWVEAWPQVDSRSARTVEVECLDVVGLAARGDAPVSAFRATGRALDPQPAHWWLPDADGWRDQITGAAARHTGGLVEMDELVDGDGRSWGQTDPDGFGATTARVPDADGDRAWTVVSAFVRFPTDRLVDSVLNQRMPTVVCWQPVWYSGVQFDRLLVTVFDGHLSAGMTSWDFASGVRTSAAWSTAEDSGTPSVVNLFDGERHHLMVAMRAGHPDWTVAYAWVDGRRLDLPLVHWSQGEGAPPVHGDNAQLRIGVGAGTSVYNGTPFQGQLDHVMIWANFVGVADDLDSMAVTLHRAGRLAWAGQRLDERLERIATGMNVDGLLGELDTSGIVTGHGFRSGNPLELLQKIEDTEQGRVWVDRHGLLRFSSREALWREDVATFPQAVFSDDPDELAAGALPMVADLLKMAKDPRHTTNVAQVTSEHGRMQTVEDRDSIAVRGRLNPVHLSGLLHSSDRQSQAIAEWIVASSSEPRWRVESLTFRAEDHPALARLARTIEEGWLVEVRRAGRVVSGHVVSIAHQVDLWGWQVTVALDSTRAGMSFFRVDQSAADSTDPVSF